MADVFILGHGTSCWRILDLGLSWFNPAGPEFFMRWIMSPLLWLLTVWGVLTTILIVLLIYRSTLSMHEEEQLFLDESSSQMAQEHREVMKKVDKIKPLVRVFGAASGVLILVIAGIWVYQSWTAV